MMAWDDASELRNAALGEEIFLRALTERERKVRRDFWTKFKRFAGQVPFAEDIVAGYYSALDPATPIRVRAMLLAAIAYFILPLDLIPDIVAGLGFADDAALIPCLRSSPPTSRLPIARPPHERSTKELPRRT